MQFLGWANSIKRRQFLTLAEVHAAQKVCQEAWRIENNKEEIKSPPPPKTNMTMERQQFKFEDIILI